MIFSDLQNNYYITKADCHVNRSILHIVKQRRLIECAMLHVKNMNCIGFNFIAIAFDYVLCELSASSITSKSISNTRKFFEFRPGLLNVRSNFTYIVLHEHFKVILLTD